MPLRANPASPSIPWTSEAVSSSSPSFSPDGKLAVSGSGWPQGDCTVRLWDVATGKEIRRLRADELALMIMEDAFGLRTELRFRQIVRNPQIDPALFTFEPPAGVDVIGDLADGSDGL